MAITNYNSAGYDELINDANAFRAFAEPLGKWLEGKDYATLSSLNDQAATTFYRKGVTFTVYSEANNIERVIPFDIIPRVIPLSEWRTIEAGCKQRIRALNQFIHDIYHQKEIIKAGVIPEQQVLANTGYEPWMNNIQLPVPIYAHISGVDLIRDDEGEYLVLEDNLRTPSGVSYMLESRQLSTLLLDEVYQQQKVMPVSDYPKRLKECLKESSGKFDPQVVVLTPGRFNSAYYEHAFLAREMNVPLVQAQDLFVQDNILYLKGVTGQFQVDVIYRRIDDPYLDPLAFRGDSILGIAGLMGAYRAGNLVLVNAPGTGIADDKSIYRFVPKMIEFYLGESAILKNVETHDCADQEALNYVLGHLDELVVKEVHGSGGYGMLVGPKSTKAEIKAYRERLLANPAGFIAQPTISLSTCPTAIDEQIAPRHIDLRPFVLNSPSKIHVVPGGLTRVAMREGSLVVNSSQGGGVKDTWVVNDAEVSSQD